MKSDPFDSKTCAHFTSPGCYHGDIFPVSKVSGINRMTNAGAEQFAYKEPLPVSVHSATCCC